VRVTLFDYGAGNIHSLAKAIARAGIQPTVEPDPLRALDTDLLVLPGVGAFAQAAGRIGPARDALRAAIEAGLPCLGICLGMQLLFDDSEEGGGPGLGVFSGRVTRLRATEVPQIGWNAIEPAGDRIFERVGLREAYYANSYVCRPVDERVVIGWSEHQGDRYPAAVRRDAVLGVQFHPEKSSEPGVRLIADYLGSVRR